MLGAGDSFVLRESQEIYEKNSSHENRSIAKTTAILEVVFHEYKGFVLA
jgi:hypothetical protein